MKFSTKTKVGVIYTFWRKFSVISDRVHNLYYMQIKKHDAIRTALPASSAVVVSPNNE